MRVDSPQLSLDGEDEERKLSNNLDSAIGIAVILVLVSVVVLISLRGRWLTGLRP